MNCNATLCQPVDAACLHGAALTAGHSTGVADGRLRGNFFLAGLLIRFFGHTLPRLGNVTRCLKSGPDNAGFDHAKIVIGQKIVEVKLIVSFASNAVRTVLHQRFAIGLLSGTERRAPGLALVKGFQIVVVEIIEIALSHVGQAGIAVDPVAGDIGCGRESTYASSLQSGSGQVVRHSIAG